MARIFKTPFGAQGDTEQVPEAPQGDGSVSLTQGFGYDYEREYEDPAAKDIRREAMNGLFHDITEAIGDIQLTGIAKWDAAAAPYPAGAVVWHDSVAWMSTAGNNSSVPVDGSAQWEELRGLGDLFLGDYAPGIEVTEYSQFVREAGEFWRASAGTTLPYTTTGAGMPEGGAFVPAGDAVLRQDLANPDKGAAMVARGVVAVDSIADLLALPEGQKKEGLRYLVKGYHSGSEAGGGEFYYDPTRQAENDSGSVLDGFVRIIGGYVTPAMFGARGDGVADDTTHIQSALDYGGRVHVEGGTYLINTERAGSNESRTGLQINKSGTTFTSSGDVVFQSIPRTARWGSILSIPSGVSDVVVEGGKFIGSKYNPSYTSEFEYGITVWDTQRVTIRDLSIKDMAGDGIHFIWPRDTDFSTVNGVLVDNCDISDCRRHEITILAGVNIMVRGCRLYKTSDVRDGIVNATYGGLNVDIEGFAYQTVRSVSFINTYFSCPTNYAFRADQHGSTGSTGILMQNCVVESHGFDGLGGFEFVNCDDVSVLGCTFGGLWTGGSGDSYAVSLSGCTNSVVRNNYIAGGTSGVRVTTMASPTIVPSSNVVIEGNILDGLDGGFGINVTTGGGSAVVSGNEFRSSCRFTFAFIRAVGTTEDMSSIVVSNNLVTGLLSTEVARDAVDIRRASDLTFLGNSIHVTSESTGSRLVRLEQVLTGAVKNNRFTAKSDMGYLLYINNVQNTLIGDNYFTKDAGAAVSAVIWFLNNLPESGLIVKGNTWKGAANSNIAGSAEGVLRVLNTQVDGSLDSAV